MNNSLLGSNLHLRKVVNILRNTKMVINNLVSEEQFLPRNLSFLRVLRPGEAKVIFVFRAFCDYSSISGNQETSPHYGK